MIAPVKSLEPLQTGEARIFVERAGVPSLVRDPKVRGRLIAVFQWFPMEEERRAGFDRVAIRVSGDDGKTWESPRSVALAGLPEGFMRPFDPTLVALPDGRYRLYFTSSRMEFGDRPAQGVSPEGMGARGFPGEGRGPQGPGGFGPPDSLSGPRGARGPRGPGAPGGPGGPGDRPATSIYSAISSDLKTFTFEPGERSSRNESGIVDAAVGTLGVSTYMLAHPGPRRSPFEVTQGYFAVSADGLSFDRRNNLVGPFGGDFIGNFLSSKDRLLFFGGGRSGIWSISTRDGSEWSAPLVSQVRGGDPVVFSDHAGKQWLIYVGDVRPDAVGRPAWLPGPQGGPGMMERQPGRGRGREEPRNDGPREI